MKWKTKTLVLMTMFTAIAVAGSVFVSFPAGVARAYPVQHAVNVIAAVSLGPGPAVGIAFLTALIRILTGTGSLLAFPGGMIGALLAGWLYRKTGRAWTASAGEMVGTGVLASLVAAPYANLLMGASAGAFFFLPAFLVSSISGALIGLAIVMRLESAGRLPEIGVGSTSER